MGGRGEGGFYVSLTSISLNGHVMGHLWKERFTSEGFLRCEERPGRFDFQFDAIERCLRCQGLFGDDRDDRLSHCMYLVRREKREGGSLDRPADRVDRKTAQSLQLLRRDHGDDPRDRGSPGDIEMGDSAARMRTAQEKEMQAARGC